MLSVCSNAGENRNHTFKAVKKRAAAKPETVAIAIAGFGFVVFGAYTYFAGSFVIHKAGIYLIGRSARLASTAEILFGVLCLVYCFRFWHQQRGKG